MCGRYVPAPLRGTSTIKSSWCRRTPPYQDRSSSRSIRSPRCLCLLTDEGLALFDSPVICEYLDSIGDAFPMVPAHGAARWRALTFQAMGDGILDASVPRRGEMMKPQDAGRVAWIARQKDVADRTISMLETDPPHRIIDIGSITIACALGYLDFRFAAQPWREGHPKLTAWYEAFAQNAGIAQTIPKDPA